MMLVALMTRETALTARTLLDDRVQRHDEDATEHADERDVGEDAPRAWVAQELHCAERSSGGCGRRCEREVQRKDRQADRAERYEPDLHFAA